MRHSVLVQRVYGVVVIALAFTAIFTALTYSILSRAMFTNIKAAELLPKARALSKLVSTSYDDENYHYAMREVLARIKAVLRRFSEKTGEEDASIIRLPMLEISLENYQVKAAGKVIPCTPKEVEILHMLTSNVGQVFSREQILSRVWGYDYFGDTRTVDAHIKRIRQKLPQENVPWALKTVYGVGYRFEVNG